MSNRISGIRLKTARAKKHVADLEDAIKAFRKMRPYEVDTNDDPNTGDTVFIFRSARMIPDDFALIAGDAIHNFRSALDHLACQLVLANGNNPTASTCYPIAETAQRYKTKRTAEVTDGMSSYAMKLIDATKPYGGGTDALWALHKLDIFDKHRLLVVFGAGHWHTNRGRGSSIYPANRVPIQDGTEIFRIRKAEHPKMNENIQFTFEIAFLEPQIVQGESVIKMLDEFDHVVDGIITRFEPLL